MSAYAYSLADSGLTGVSATPAFRAPIWAAVNEGQLSSICLLKPPFRLAVHPRCYTPGEYVTQERHRPQDHLDWLAPDFEDWRTSLCEDLKELVDITMHRNPNAKREKKRVIERVRRLEKQYKLDRLCAAINVAREGNALNFRHVDNILRNNVDANPDVAREPVMAIKPVNNVRGPAYFAAEIARQHATSASHLHVDGYSSHGEVA